MAGPGKSEKEKEIGACAKKEEEEVGDIKVK